MLGQGVAKRLLTDPRQFLARYLDARQVAPMVADSHLPQPLAAEILLRPINPLQSLRSHLFAVGHPAGEAWRSGLVPDRQPPIGRQRPHLVLGHAAIGQRAANPVFGRRPLSRTVIPRVVGVRSAQHRVHAQLGEHPDQMIEQVRFAVVATIDVVPRVVGVVEFVGGNHDVPDADQLGQPARLVQLAGRQTRARSGHRHGALPQGQLQPPWPPRHCPRRRKRPPHNCPARESARVPVRVSRVDPTSSSTTRAASPGAKPASSVPGGQKRQYLHRNAVAMRFVRARSKQVGT